MLLPWRAHFEYLYFAKIAAKYNTNNYRKLQAMKQSTQYKEKHGPNYNKSSAVAEMGDRGHNSVGCHSSA